MNGHGSTDKHGGRHAGHGFWAMLACCLPTIVQLTRHQLLLTAQEAIFVFETADERGLQALLAEVDVWAAASTWHDLVTGPPRLAEVAYSWERPEPSVVPAIGLGL